MKGTLRDFDTFVGIDLGGARGKTTAVARIRNDAGNAVVESVSARDGGGRPWRDEVLVELFGELGSRAAVAIDAPLTAPACVRCIEAVCPGQAVCAVPAVVWLRTQGAELVSAARAHDRDRIAAVPAGAAVRARGFDEPPAHGAPPAPYTHRCTEVFLCHERGLMPREALGRGPSPVSARARHLRRQAARLGFSLNENLIEVSPRSTVHALFGRRAARGYRRDADPWHTRAQILDGLRDLSFSPRSCLSKEEVLRSDHCFDALLSAYTAFLWSREGWTLPEDSDGALISDGWIWVPPKR
ncbi:MAG TPA: DUF429 domain-containing protein [Kofleriaceae bacterium]|nr:DUF429 domain-containing protein [Kofleriaceae bacterium]